jgi:hypothetical protein
VWAQAQRKAAMKRLKGVDGLTAQRAQLMAQVTRSMA